MANFRTPLRYPGGKQKLAPFLLELLRINNIDGQYVEPFAGGAGIGIELLLSKEINQIYLNDSNRGIYAFWYSVINFTDEFCRMIHSTVLNVDEWKKQKEISKNSNSDNLLELGFSIFYLNRCNRSGVLSGGVIGGMNQTGNYKIDARFSRNDLIRRIEAIAIFKDKISIFNCDAEEFLTNNLTSLSENCLIYLDPPYYEKGSDLYLNHYKKKDHDHLAKVIQNQIKKKWVLSYDGVPQIIELYKDRRYFLYDLQYSASKSYKGKEIFVFCDSLLLPSSCTLKFINERLSTLHGNKGITEVPITACP